MSEQTNHGVLPLTFPINHGGEQLTELPIKKRVSLEDMEALDKIVSNVSRLKKLIGMVTLLPPSAVNQIDATDLPVIEEKLTPFLPATPKEKTDED